VAYSKITSGLEAMNYYEQYRQAELPIEKEMIKADLLEYCNTDCLATYELIGFLENLTGKREAKEPA
jgi:hypothetical protein